MPHRMRYVFALILLLAGFIDAAPPKVVITSPDNGEVDVDPGVREIRIEFDQPMDPEGRSILGGGERYPEFAGELKWADPKTLVIPVKLKPDNQYYFNLNSDTWKGFQNNAGQPAEWYPVQFKTRAQGAAPAEPDVTPAQNKEAVAALKRALDQDYGYRDRKKIDWAKEIACARASWRTPRPPTSSPAWSSTCCALPRTRTSWSRPATSASGRGPIPCRPTSTSRR